MGQRISIDVAKVFPAGCRHTFMDSIPVYGGPGERMQRGRTLFRTVAGALIAGVLLGTAVPASAATPPQPVAADAAAMTAASSTVAVGAVAAAGTNASCFGYTGTFMNNSHIV